MTPLINRLSSHIENGTLFKLPFTFGAFVVFWKQTITIFLYLFISNQVDGIYFRFCNLTLIYQYMYIILSLATIYIKKTQKDVYFHLSILHQFVMTYCDMLIKRHGNLITSASDSLLNSYTIWLHVLGVELCCFLQSGLYITPLNLSDLSV